MDCQRGTRRTATSLHVYSPDGAPRSVTQEAGFLRTALDDLPKAGISVQSLDWISFRCNESEAVRSDISGVIERVENLYLRIVAGAVDQPEPMQLKYDSRRISDSLVASLLCPVLYPDSIFGQVKTIAKPSNCAQIFRMLLVRFNCFSDPFYNYIDHSKLY